MTVILNEFIAVTGYDRKYAIRVLLGPIQPPAPIRRPRAAHYGVEVQQALASAWLTANGICAKRLVSFLAELIPTLERHGHLILTDEVREQVLALSSANGRSVASTTTQPAWAHDHEAGAAAQQADPDTHVHRMERRQPWISGGDLVAHCGGSLEGAFLYTLTLTDVATTWTECLRCQAAEMGTSHAGGHPGPVA
jgi:hypothetical protein